MNLLPTCLTCRCRGEPVTDLPDLSRRLDELGEPVLRCHRSVSRVMLPGSWLSRSQSAHCVWRGDILYNFPKVRSILLYLLKSQEIRLVPYLSSTNLSNMVFYNYDLRYDKPVYCVRIWFVPVRSLECVHILVLRYNFGLCSSHNLS